MKQFLTSLLLFCFSVAASAADISTERYKEIFSSQNRYQIKEAVQTLPLTGYTDVEAFDSLEAELLRSLPLANDKSSIDYSAWLLKGLAFSGNSKYRKTFEEVASGEHHRKIRKYAKKSLDILEQYQMWNPTLNNKDNYQTNQSPHHNAIRNAIMSDSLQLKYQAAQYIYSNQLPDTFLLDALQTELTSSRLLKHEKISIKTYAWMAKSLASSSNQKYHQTISTLATDSSEKKLRKYATKYLRSYF